MGKIIKKDLEKNEYEKNLTFTFLCDTITIEIIKKDLEKNEYEKNLTFIILYDII